MGPASWSVTGGPGQSSDPVANREGGVVVILER